MNGLILMDVASAQSCQGAGFVGMVCCCPAAAPRSGCIDFFAFVIVRGLKPPGYTPPPLPGHLRIPRPEGAKVTRLRPRRGICVSPVPKGQRLYGSAPAGAFAYPPVPPGQRLYASAPPGHLRIPPSRRDIVM